MCEITPLSEKGFKTIRSCKSPNYYEEEVTYCFHEIDIKQVIKEFKEDIRAIMERRDLFSKDFDELLKKHFGSLAE